MVAGKIRIRLLGYWATLSAVVDFLIKETVGDAVIHSIESHVAEFLGVPEATVVATVATYALPLVIVWLLVWGVYRLGQSSATAPQKQDAIHSADALQPVQQEDIKADIDAREAFYQILQKSEWRVSQQSNPPDPRTVRSDWLKIRLSTEIHNHLAQGRLTAWGETNLANSTGPQRRIKPEEWEQSEIVFDEQRQFPRTYAKFRNNDRVSHHGVMFSETQIFRLFPLVQSNTPSIDRITITELLQLATAFGWNFSDNSVHLIDLQEALQQGGLDATLVIWGKLAKWTSDDLMRQEPLEKISSDHWKDHRVHLFAARDGDNFSTYSWSPTTQPFGKRQYIDLHVERFQAISWLQRDASGFKGRTKPR